MFGNQSNNLSDLIEREIKTVTYGTDYGCWTGEKGTELPKGKRGSLHTGALEPSQRLPWKSRLQQVGIAL